MTHIKLRNIDLTIPVFDVTNRSLKRKILSVASRRRFGSDGSGQIHINVLKNFSLEINEGDRIAVLGRNGAGKTSFLRLLNGVYPPTNGSLDVSGKVNSLIDISLGINENSTGRENIFLRGALIGMSRDDIVEKMEEIINWADLESFIDLPLRTYSTGMQLRLAFSIATLIVPEILILDEWLSVGDAEFAQKAEKRTHELIHQSQIFIVATHSEHVARNFCNRAIWVDGGEIVMDGPSDIVADKYFNNTDR